MGGEGPNSKAGAALNTVLEGMVLIACTVKEMFYS